MAKTRSVVNSRGEKFPSVLEAANAVWLRSGTIYAAARATRYGMYLLADKCQWAYADEIPETWPELRIQSYRVKSVTNSNGDEFPNMTEAARSFSVNVGSISHAVKATKCGKKLRAAGLQWALTDEIPEVWPVEVSAKPSVQASVSELSKPIYPPEFTEKQWRVVPGLPDYEVSSIREIRRVKNVERLQVLLPIVFRGEASLVILADVYYNVVDLMMLAFVGPKPYGYTVWKRAGESEVLSNLFYGPRKPRTKTGGMTHQEIMDQLRSQSREGRNES